MIHETKHHKSITAVIHYGKERMDDRAAYCCYALEPGTSSFHHTQVNFHTNPCGGKRLEVSCLEVAISLTRRTGDYCKVTQTVDVLAAAEAATTAFVCLLVVVV